MSRSVARQGRTANLIHIIGTTREDFAEVAMAIRANAVDNPNATLRKPMTREDYFAAPMLADLIRAGVHAFKIEGRQRSRAYVQTVVSAFRAAIDSTIAGQSPRIADLVALTEGRKQTEGALKSKKWR